MALYEEWVKTAYRKDGRINKTLWDQYMPLEQEVYQYILREKITVIKGTVSDLGIRFRMPVEYVCGFIDGLNEVIPEPIKLEELNEYDEVELKLDFEKLYKKMVEYKAEHLFSLPEWNNVFTEAERKQFFTEQKKSGTVVKEEKVGRNEPCPCGSGKKYKKCCGMNE